MNAERVFTLLLQAYPAAFRATDGREMTLVFRDQWRANGGGGVAFWAAMLLDVARSAPPARVEEYCARRAERLTHSGEGTMRPMALLALTVGALEVVWIGRTELWAGGIQGGDGVSLAAGALAVVAGLLLAAAGVALLRGGAGAVQWARGAAIGCVASFAIIALALPRLGIAAMALGFLVPITLLVVLWRGGSTGTPTMA